MTQNPNPWSPDRLKARRRRARALAWILVGLALLIFLLTLVKLGGNVAIRQI